MTITSPDRIRRTASAAANIPPTTAQTLAATKTVTDAMVADKQVGIALADLTLAKTETALALADALAEQTAIASGVPAPVIVSPPVTTESGELASALPGSGSITDSKGVIWTLSTSGVAARGGVPDVVTNGIVKLVYHLHTVYQNAWSSWWSWNGLVWVVATDPTVVTPPIVVPPANADPTPTQQFIWPSTPGVVPPPSLINWDRLGGGGFGNGELETYTNSASNIYLDGHGNLVIVAKADKTSARVNLIPWGYIDPGSYWEIPAIVPPNGWTAIWTIGKNATTVPWPTCGEGDLVEINNKDALGNVHVGNSSNGDVESGWGYPTCDAGPVDGKTTDVWGMYFDATVVKYYRNRKLFMQWTAAQAKAAGGTWPFNQSIYVILNIAIMSGDTGFTGGQATFGGIKAWKGTLPALTG